MKTITPFALAISLASLSGCMFDYDFGGGDWEDDDGWGDSGEYYGSDVTELSASAAELRGDLGTIELAGAARVHEAVDWGYGAVIDLRQEGVLGGVGMARLDIDGASIVELEAGTYHSNAETFSYTSDEPSFQVTGCSGPRDGSWDYDLQADEVTVVVEEIDPVTVRVRYTATFNGYSTSDGSDTVTGDVLVQR